MKTFCYALIFIGFVVLMYGILTGKPQPPDPEVQRVIQKFQAFDRQLEAQGNYMEAAGKELDCQTKGDTNGQAYWNAKCAKYDSQEKAAYAELKAIP